MAGNAETELEMNLVSDIKRPASFAAPVADPRLRRRLVEIRKLTRNLRTTSYEITNSCNLRCEGCLFFAGDMMNGHADTLKLDLWRDFFKREAARGINYAFLAGGETSLVPDRIQAAADAIPFGVIVTNGTKKIDARIRYQIHISLWGGSDTTALVRGADINQKAFDNYRGDPRTVFVYTINPFNIGEMAEMAEKCARNSVKMTFSYFSPTEEYTARIENSDTNDDAYFRFSNKDKNLMFSPADFARARREMESLKRKHPETILFSPAYDDWVSQQDGLYDLDENGIATNCVSRTDRWHTHYHADHREKTAKCGNGNFDCSQCRAYAPAFTTFARRFGDHIHNAEALQGWIEAFHIWREIFIGDQTDEMMAHSPSR